MSRYATISGLAEPFRMAHRMKLEAERRETRKTTDPRFDEAMVLAY
jgi:hypothetical protein